MHGNNNSMSADLPKDETKVLVKNTNTALDDNIYKADTTELMKLVAAQNQQPIITSALRYNEGKLPMHLVPVDAIEALAAVLAAGAKKYQPRNWELGSPYSTPYASLQRHLLKFWSGEDTDPETGLPHLAHALCNAAFLLRYYNEFKHLDDRPHNGRK